MPAGAAAPKVDGAFAAYRGQMALPNQGERWCWTHPFSVSIRLCHTGAAVYVWAACARNRTSRKWSR